ncbi:hypothetical protein EGH21_03300 [Halomicroarcula sp. F13]|uniref:DUF8152 domain-containing protein n=1 Tax=Haloarcula rubra TaxID=2487747 RepID=A0AAW4PLZ2_9EURY|nr:hypothetical protein [Halomicroarcula rubra]
MSDDRVRAVYDHLAATGERPVERTASRWLGEAEAVARDVVEGDLDPAVRRRRLETVADLLDNVAETGDEIADDHVAAARVHLEALRSES